MKISLRLLAVLFSSSIVCTFMLHAYVYQHHAQAKLTKMLQLETLVVEYRSQNSDKFDQKPRSNFKEEEAMTHIVRELTSPRDAITTNVITHPVTEEVDDEYDYVTREEDLVEYEETCQLSSADLLGPLKVNSSLQRQLKETLTSAGDDMISGCYRPRGCKAEQKVAIVIPYKNRYQHLLTLLHHLNPILQRQKIMYCVFVAEQFDNGVFNKARVMNAAYLEIMRNWQKHRDPHGRLFDCFVFHDVDMLSEDDRNLYLCGKSPKHMSPAIDKFNYTTNYGTKYGGVTAIRTEHYKLVNGHSNRFWGWGGEDNDMETRISDQNLTIDAVNETIGRYKMIEHIHPWWFSPISGVGSSYRKHTTKPKKVQAKKEEENSNYKDTSGISDMKYTVTEIDRKRLWTRISLDIRNYVVEKIQTSFKSRKEAFVEVKSPQSLNTPKSHKDSDEQIPEDQCVDPEYYKFPSMTVNRTTSMNEVKYTHVYKSLEEAKRDCNLMLSLCQSIVEQVKGRYTLRSNAYVQENILIYKFGLAEQNDVVEKHFSTAAYVKICPQNPSYTQFITSPIIMKGDETSGPVPRYQVEFYIRLFHPSKTSFTHSAQVMTTHRAVMEEKYTNRVIKASWWDSLGKVQFTRTKVINMTLDSVVDMFTVEKDEHSRLLRIRTPFAGLLRDPGCYYIRNKLIENESDAIVMEWAFWLQLRAESKEIEEKILKNNLQRSVESGKQFNKMMAEREEVMKSYIEDKKQRDMQKGREEYLGQVRARHRPNEKPKT
ncbi:unnamed protein product [Clavelina lepadiformis]|uniref:Uncharacterized protein n=1 Tax=Clavelina lepadiformis TaxID=159417 RepID=A0ABP0G9L2_CLALP